MNSCQTDWICQNYVYEGYIDEILNKVFRCKNQVSGYKSRFYHLQEVKMTRFQTLRKDIIEFDNEMHVFWLITHKDFIFVDNNYNYEKFLAKCHSVPYQFYWMISVCILMIIIVFVHVLYIFTKKVKIPKIFIPRAPNTVVIVRQARNGDAKDN